MSDTQFPEAPAAQPEQVFSREVVPLPEEVQATLATIAGCVDTLGERIGVDLKGRFVPERVHLFQTLEDYRASWREAGTRVHPQSIGGHVLSSNRTALVQGLSTDLFTVAHEASHALFQGPNIMDDSPAGPQVWGQEQKGVAESLMDLFAIELTRPLGPVKGSLGYAAMDIITDAVIQTITDKQRQPLDQTKVLIMGAIADRQTHVFTRLVADALGEDGLQAYMNTTGLEDIVTLTMLARKLGLKQAQNNLCAFMLGREVEVYGQKVKHNRPVRTLLRHVGRFAVRFLAPPPPQTKTIVTSLYDVNPK